MKSAIQFALLLTLASLGRALPQGLGVQYVDDGKKGEPTVPSVWLYWGECFLSMFQVDQPLMW